MGAGYLDVAAALASSEVATGSAMSPIAYSDSATGMVYLVDDATAIWGNGAVWGHSVLLSASGAVWGHTAIWGTSTTAGFGAV